MVRKSCAKYGFCTGRTLKSDHLSSYYQRSHSTQCLITKTIGNNSHLVLTKNEKNEIQDKFQEYFDDGGISAITESTHRWFHHSNQIKYSLNKRKRWELPGILKENILDSECHQDLDFRVILCEYEVAGTYNGNAGGKRQRHASCTGVWNSKSDKPEKKPKQKYAHVEDFLNDPRPSRRQRERQPELGDNNSASSAIADITYTVENALSPLQYPVYRENDFKYSGGKWFQKSKSKEKSEKVANFGHWHGGYQVKDLKRMQQSDYAAEMDYHGYTYSYDDIDELSDDDNGERDECRSYERPEFPSIGDVFHEAMQKYLHSDGHQGHRCGNQRNKVRQSASGATSAPVKMHGKGMAIFDPTIATENTPSEVETNPSSVHEQLDTTAGTSLSEERAANKPAVLLRIDPVSLESTELEASFGDSYQEGHSLPKRFSIDITSAVIGAMYERGEDKLARQLQDCGNPIYVIFEEIEVKNADSEQMRVTLFGCRPEFLSQVQALMDSHYKKDHVYSVFDVVEQIVNIVDVIPCESIMLNDGVCKQSKQTLTLTKMKKICGWDYITMTPYQTCQSNFTVQKHSSPYKSDREKIYIEDFVDISPDLCGICYDHLGDEEEATCLHGCRHWFCNKCWQMHVTARVHQGDIDIKCPEYKCTQTVDDVTLMALLPVDQYQVHMQHLRDIKLNSSSNFHWCPSPKCGRVVKINQSHPRSVSVQCDCGKLWCSQCKAEAHWPATCEQAKSYRQLRKDFGDDNSKPSRGSPISHVLAKSCPSCNHPMEKNGGCQQMTCRCGHLFCWECLASWDSHITQGWSMKGCKSKANFETYRLVDVTKSSFHQDFYKIAIKFHKERNQENLRKFHSAVQKLAGKMFLSKRQASRKRPSCDSMSEISTSDSSGYHTSSDCEWNANAETSEISTRSPTDNIFTKRNRNGFVNEISQFYAEIVYLAEHVAVLCGKCSRRRRSTNVLHLLWQLDFVISRLHQIIMEGDGLTMKHSDEKLRTLMRIGENAIKTLVKHVPGVHRRLEN
ncbi:uncharacterized protein [Ptychodera flava]|uniref:uncharacterized protein n=1 Tax=Ptychodera flava TaxID=63121 RepID=UPI00396A06E1